MFYDYSEHAPDIGRRTAPGTYSPKTLPAGPTGPASEPLDDSLRLRSMSPPINVGWGGTVTGFPSRASQSWHVRFVCAIRLSPTRL